MAELSPNILLVTLNVDDLNTLIKRKMFAVFKKHGLPTSVLSVRNLV